MEIYNYYFKKLNVREAELIARKIAFDRARKKERMFDPEIVELEEKLAETLGTRVSIERKDQGGKLTIDFFNDEDLRNILSLVNSNKVRSQHENLEKHIEAAKEELPVTPVGEMTVEQAVAEVKAEEDSDEMYSVKNFSL